MKQVNLQIVHRAVVHHRMRGFTLFELIITITIASILAATAVPSFRASALNNARRTVVNDVMSAIMVARSEAVKRGVSVQVCGSGDGTTCLAAGSDWSKGVLVVADSSKDNVFDTADDFTVLYTGALDDRLKLSSNRAEFIFRPFNQASTNGTVSVCDQRGAEESRAIIVALSGRPHVSTDGANDANC